jgi:biotin carboxylase
MHFNETKFLLIFGGSILQRSLLLNAKKMGLITVVIDPDKDASERNTSDYFEVVAGDDFEGTCEVVMKYNISGIITAATDKPLVMMAMIAEKFNFPFYSVATAQMATDKWIMKKIFQENDIPCAKGIETKEITPISNYPVILKPKDNSGSRGVYYCETPEQLNTYFEQSKTYTKKDSVIIEEFIPGAEFSVEAIHSENHTTVVQITEKTTSAFPFNVELSHIAPAALNKSIIDQINSVILKIATAFNYKFCVSHTELKVHGNSISIIETSPRLGGDFITSHLVPLSTGVNIENKLIELALGEKIIPLNLKDTPKKIACIQYFNLPGDYLNSEVDVSKIIAKYKLIEMSFALQKGDRIPKITNSLDRYGYYIFTVDSGVDLMETKQKISNEFN